MTHSLHRQGTEKDLKTDYVLLAQLARGINRDDPEARQNFVKIGSLFKKHNPVSIMNESAWKVTTTLTGSYDKKRNVVAVLKDLKKKDFGISIVISGLLSEIIKISKKMKIKNHTVHLSLGVFGKKELLPEEKKILEITTMCGHHCISPQSIVNHIEKIRKGKTTIEKVANKLSEPCVCGIVNGTRVQKILKDLIEYT